MTFEELELAPGFYYTSGIESFISTMETSALMGMNVAQLIVDDHLDIPNGQLANEADPLQKVLSDTQTQTENEEL